ncbi:MAG: hypothetical protein OXG60_17310 [Chloroflexi bacterium]|nr:hypothetical protein [Chloroflexota bacterium]
MQILGNRIETFNKFIGIVELLTIGYLSLPYLPKLQPGQVIVFDQLFERIRDVSTVPVENRQFEYRRVANAIRLEFILVDTHPEVAKVAKLRSFVIQTIQCCQDVDREVSGMADFWDEEGQKLYVIRGQRSYYFLGFQVTCTTPAPRRKIA